MKKIKIGIFGLFNGENQDFRLQDAFLATKRVNVEFLYSKSGSLRRFTRSNQSDWLFFCGLYDHNRNANSGRNGNCISIVIV